MKRHTLYIYMQKALLWMGILSVAACQSDELAGVDRADDVLDIETSTHTTLSRTTLSEDGTSVVWTEGDAIAVFDGATPKRLFTAIIEGGTTHFKGNITPKTSDFMAVYPYNLASENLQGRQMLVTLPSTQTASPNTFSSGLNISVAKGTRNIDGSPSIVRFANMCQVFRFSVPAYAAGRISSIQLQADVVLAGQMAIDYSNGNPVPTVSEQGEKTVTILPPTGSDTFAEGTYCIVTVPAQMQGFTFLLHATDGKTYRQHSGTSIGGNASVIADLRTLDLIDTPQITASHVYADGVLQGTKVTLTAPVPGKPWSAVIKNAQGTVVRTLEAAEGTLTTDETDAEWPYLPMGNYTVDYDFTTANGKTITSHTAFNITEKPEFGVSLNAASSYSYYLGEGVAKNVTKANSMDAYAVDAITATVTGIAPRILSDSKYTGTLSNTFNGTATASSNGVTSFQDITLSQLGQSTLGVSYTFEGVTREASKQVYITGVPHVSNPPTKALWSSSGKVSFENSYVRLGQNGTGSTFDITCSQFSIPTNTKLVIYHREQMKAGLVGANYNLYVGSNSVVNESVGRYGTNNLDASINHTTTENITSIRCHNSYGAAQTYTDVYNITVTYGE